MSYSHLYGKSQNYQGANNANSRSRANESGNKYRHLRDSKIIADKIEPVNIHYDEIARMEVLNDSEIPRQLMTMNTFRKYYVCHDLSHKNAANTEDGIYYYEVTGSKMVSGGGKMYNSSAVIKIEVGMLKIPSYLTTLGYDLSEIFVNIRNLVYSFNNGNFPYQFKMFPSQILSFNDPIKNHYESDMPEFNMATPQNLDIIELELRDKTSRIFLPSPINSATLTTGAQTIFNAQNHGLQNGFVIAVVKCSNYNISGQLTRLNAVTIINANSFSVNVDTSNLSYLNNQACEYLVDNFNFELNIKVININWDTNAIASGRK